MIERYYFHSLVIRRVKDTGGIKQQYVATGTIDAHLQRIDDRNTVSDPQIAGASHRVWCDASTNIKEDDRVIDSQGNEYHVVAVRTDGVDWAMNQHKEVYLRIYND